MSDLAAIETRLDDVTTALLPPLRASKTLSPGVVDELMVIGRDFAEAVASESVVSRTLVGKTWFVFTAMLAEADHTATPEPILTVAWQWQEWLRRAFGPTF